jgi:hypothetical protein
MYSLHIARLVRGSFGAQMDHVSGTATEVATGAQRQISIPFEIFVDKIARDSICQRSVRTGYILEQVDDNNTFFLMFYYDSSLFAKSPRFNIRKLEPIGFIMGNIDLLERDLYIDVICAGPRTTKFKDHSGAMLIEEAIEVARSSRLRSITLSSLPTVLTYYPRFQFAHRKSCDRNVDASLPDVIIRRMKREPGTVSLPATVEAAYKNKDMLDYMIELHEKGYSKKYHGKCALNSMGKISRDSFLKGECGDDGFEMKYCLPRDEKEDPRKRRRTK